MKITREGERYRPGRKTTKNNNNNGNLSERTERPGVATLHNSLNEKSTLPVHMNPDPFNYAILIDPLRITQIFLVLSVLPEKTPTQNASQSQERRGVI